MNRDDRRATPIRFHFRVIWTQWLIGIWWWPVKKDRTVGFSFGPFHGHWNRNEH
jgi:hypothetical protein